MESCGLLLKQINEALKRDANEALAGQNLTLSQVGLLAELRSKEKATASMKELEAALAVAQPTVVGIVKRLEQKGFVISFEAPYNHRVKLVQLTEKGMKNLIQGELHMRETEGRILGALSEDQRSLFPEMLRAVLEALSV